MLLISTPRFEDHIPPPGHPERPERAHVFDAVAERWVQKGGRTIAPRLATRQELERAHTASHVDTIERTAGQAVMLDPDTFTSFDSERIAKLAAGAAVQAVQHAVEHGEAACALVRPPGHHAERDRAMGFCLFNNAAVGAYAALDLGLTRVAIVDIDVHHGNGTQAIFYDDPRVLYISTHQFPFYPGTGAVDELGRGEGTGFTVNVPLAAGSGDADYDVVVRAVIEPVLEQFAPNATIVSAGFDAHERDPLASMRLTTEGYGHILGRLRHASSRSGTALSLVTEGGYDLSALAACLEASFAMLSSETLATSGRHSVAHDASDGDVATRGEHAVRAVRAAHAGFWRGL